MLINILCNTRTAADIDLKFRNCCCGLRLQALRAALYWNAISAFQWGADTHKHTHTPFVHAAYAQSTECWVESSRRASCRFSVIVRVQILTLMRALFNKYLPVQQSKSTQTHTHTVTKITMKSNQQPCNNSTIISVRFKWKFGSFRYDSVRFVSVSQRFLIEKCQESRRRKTNVPVSTARGMLIKTCNFPPRT